MMLAEAPLIEYAERAASLRLAEHPLGGLAADECVVDLFCGGGGWDCGAAEAGIEVDYAINHWDVAIEVHQANYPKCVHHRGDAWRTRPRDVMREGERGGLLLASAACTTHSKARGGRQISKRVHMLGWCIARWMEEGEFRVVWIENVPEWKDWGPLIPRRDAAGAIVLDKHGKPELVQDPARKGQHFRRWWRYCERLGYAMEMRVVDAPDYGEASRRRRLLIQARRDGMPLVWPEVTHGALSNVSVPDGPQLGKNAHGHDFQASRDLGIQGHRALGMVDAVGVQERAGSDSRRSDVAKAIPVVACRTAADIIDWSDLGRSIFDRKRPLKEKTQKRLARGIQRFVLNDPTPFVLRIEALGTGDWGPGAEASPVVLGTCQTGGGGAASRADVPLPTQTTAQEIALGMPVLATTQNGERLGQDARVHRPDQAPLMTVTGRSGQAVCVPIVANNTTHHTGGRVDGPLPTATTGGQGALVSPLLAGAGGCEFAPQRVDQPYHAVLPREDTGLVVPIMRSSGIGALAERLKADEGVNSPTPNIISGQGSLCYTRPDVDIAGRGSGLATEITGSNPVCTVPLISYFRHGGGQHSGVCEPMMAITAGGTHAAMVAPLTMQYYGNAGEARRPDEPLGAVTTLDRHAAVLAVLSNQDLMLARGRRVAAWLGQHLGDGVPIDAETGLAYVVIGGVKRFFVDVLFRMLKPLELARAMGFPDSYRWAKTQRDTVKLIGNAVSVKTAAAHIRASLPRGRKA